MTIHRHRMPFGAETTPEGTRFALWAPTAGEVSLVLGEATHPMPDEGRGWRRLVLPGTGAGSRYAFRIDGRGLVPDPASRSQPDDVGGPSEVVDPAAFAWSDTEWTGRPWEEAVLYELHVGTATRHGTFAALEHDLERLRDLGITAIELLPIADFAGGRNWGYDGVLPYAPESAYGTPDDLKRLIDRAHSLGLMVLLDVVYNHFGPTGNYLHAYADTFFTERHQTPWGAGLNFDGAAAGPAVRDFFVHNALYWLEEYRFDGLRFDAVHAILDDSATHIVAEIATRVRQAFPDRHIHLVLENEANEARWLPRDEGGKALLHTAQWNDDIHHCWHILLTGETDAYYADFADRPAERLARCLAEGFAYQGEVPLRGDKPRGEPSAHLPPTAFVGFLQNHDQIGNRAYGERIDALAPPERLALARAVLLLCPQIPMLFMGEEWAASTPFQFFVDFPDEDLSRAVREGRRREFSGFAAFADPHAIERIPDPTIDGPFAASTLRHEEAREPPHAAILAETKTLIALRHRFVVPLIKTRFIAAEQVVPAGCCVVVRWRFSGGELRLAANVGDEPVRIAWVDDGETVWSSPGIAVEGGTLALPGWSGIVSVKGLDGQP